MFTTWEAEIAALLDEAKAAGEVSPDRDTKDAAAFLTDCFEGMLVRLKVHHNHNALRRFNAFALEPLTIRQSVIEFA